MTKEFEPAKYWDERLGSLKGLLGGGFKKLGHAFNVWAYKVRRKIFISKIQGLTLNLKEVRALDIGSGTGFYIDTWNSIGVKKIAGTDITPTSVALLRQKYPNLSFFLSDIGDEDFKAPEGLRQFDVISCMDVLFHIVDDARFEIAIKNIGELLSPGGYFVYSDLYLKNRDTMRGESQVCRTSTELEKIFDRNGFELVSISPFLYLTNRPLDSKNPLLKGYWYVLENTLYLMPFLGHLFGAVIYPLELMLTKKYPDSPTTEIALYRKKRS